VSKPYVMRLASLTDLDTVMELLGNRIQWLRQRGSDQWSTGSTFRTRLTNNIACHETWLLWDMPVAVATITVSTVGDPDFWSPEELAEPAAYIGKMATSIDRAGEGIGQLMVHWVQDWAATKGLSTVRWDAWRTNSQLQDYYRSIGACYVRTVDVADRWSGALFELPAEAQPDLQEEVTTAADPSGSE
jgi:Acetyltransferase (GNAT) family